MSPNPSGGTSLVSQVMVCFVSLWRLKSAGRGDAMNEEQTAFLVSALLHVQPSGWVRAQIRTARRGSIHRPCICP